MEPALVKHPAQALIVSKRVVVIEQIEWGVAALLVRNVVRIAKKFAQRAVS